MNQKRGRRLTIGADVFETRVVATPIPNLELYLLTRNGQLTPGPLDDYTTKRSA